jgi:peptidoglycan/xylan/chitin deacetylase (PgdA/CDA1 family)
MRRLGRVFAGALALALLLATPVLAFSATCAVGARHTTLRTARASSGRISVLVYHAICDLDGDPVLADHSVPPKRFAEQLDVLKQRGWSFVDLDTVLAALDGSDGKLPDRSLLVTFDDAYVDLRDEACPILEQREIPAVAFAVAGQLGGTNEWDIEHGAEELNLLCPDGLKDVAERGVEIGSHTVSHRPLTEVPAAELDRELTGSADRLDSIGLSRPRAFAYPFGQWNEEIAGAVREAGYEVAFTVDRGAVEPDSHPYALPRFAVHADDTGRKLHIKLLTARWRHALRDAWRRVRRT